MRPFRVVAPEGVLVAVEDLRKQVRADTNEEDSLIAAYERSAVEFLDGYSGRLGRCILRQKWALPLVGNLEAVFLPFPDCRELAIERLDDQGVWSDVADATVIQCGDQALLDGLSSNLSGLHLTCWAGWETPDDVPENLKQAVRMLVAHWFDNRSAVSDARSSDEVPMGVSSLISPLVQVFAS